MTSQVLWKEPLGPDAEVNLREALVSLRCSSHELPSQEWDGKSGTIGGVRDHQVSYLAPASGAWTSLMLHLNSLIGESLAAELSRRIDGPAMALLEYDQAAWGYGLYSRGSLLDQFWNMPEEVEVLADQYQGQAEKVSAVFGVSSEMITPYLQPIDDADSEGKAFSDDEFPLSDHWVRVDFLRRIGLIYPNPGQANGGRYLRVKENGR